jgi:hypothetical protein
MLSLRAFPAAYLALSLLAPPLTPSDVRAQVEAEAVLAGTVLLGDSAMRAATVVLHRINDMQQGEIDSTRVTAGGAFSLRLPGVPNPAVGDIYFASVRHQGVMYFGPAITQAIDLDSAYVIQAWDTVFAPAEGLVVPLEGRTLFVEAQGDTWTVTDLFQLRNDLDRTVVARPEGVVWTYPLPEAATDVVTGEGQPSPDEITYDAGSIRVRGALAPGQRDFVVRYTLASPEMSIPTPGVTTYFDLLVREPAPALQVTGLAPAASVDLEGGGTYRRYSGENVASPSVQVAIGEEVRPPAVHWVAVILAGILGAGGVLAIGKARVRAPEPAGIRAGDARQQLLLEVARLDEDHQRQRSPSETSTQEYQARRADLLRRLRHEA